ncbi:MAG: UDP-N-acetylglucosamine 4,6-dehydratase (inverting) [Deltaproteobacteria bacterium]|nr:UDP-N-acetylglucosamine 4,6-dehydratase (inverting) [Deltaproteobacteria bacterium]
MDIDGKNILITGGTGSFGKKFVNFVLANYSPRRLVVFSRDELKQEEMREYLPDKAGHPIRYFIGDIRDKERLYRAFAGVDLVVHAAALKQVPTAEYNPLEVIKTNILGAANIIDAAIDCKVARVIALSSDKAVNPVNLYGGTKLCADKLFVAAGVYSGSGKSQFSVVRYGNVVGSRGSVIPGFLKQRQSGVLKLTDERMTRFWITLEQSVAFVVNSIMRMRGGEIFVPKLPSMRLMDLAKAVAPECRIEFIGIRPGEKLHETLISEDEARRTIEHEDYFVVRPHSMYDFSSEEIGHADNQVVRDFQYISNDNSSWLSIDELRTIVEKFGF